MFNPTQVLIEHFIKRLRANYLRVYGIREPEIPGLLAFCGRMALENIANSDALYHDMNHTMFVTDVGQEILYGRHIQSGGVGPLDWLDAVIALLCHDIGYVRGLLRDDRPNHFVLDAEGHALNPPPGATDACLTRWHVFRSKTFVRERFANVPRINLERICECIERTRFPVPDDPEYRRTDDLPGLVRSADLIGQMADLNYLKKSAALFYEFEECGANTHLGYTSPADVRESYPGFFWQVVRPLIHTAIYHLQVTQTGKIWIASLHAHVFAVEHRQRATDLSAPPALPVDVDMG